MAIHWKALATGAVGAIGGLGAVSLAAQSEDIDQRHGNGDIVLRAGENAVWHIAQGQLRHCRYNVSNFGNDVICTPWR